MFNWHPGNIFDHREEYVRCGDGVIMLLRFDAMYWTLAKEDERWLSVCEASVVCAWLNNLEAEPTGHKWSCLDAAFPECEVST